MELSAEFKKRIGPDLKKSELCLELGIARITLTRWMKTDLHNFRHLDVIEKVTKVLDLTQEEIFAKEKKVRKAKVQS
ncbi:hypothetical protein ASG01_08990 [Chryseobacterium sp. Leaf180]|jgi:hypothetical protein|uniref:hypothetical protein n=1 Tax=Chryseobacterium sp. Leaf180 TaxID=1736289 RepID=UPI0006F8694A|nr:hypothetical protein [Chryseobacterium sp. Leaf180]KQR93322.1 hypothetical protein ASG01_08990 [Chryseobacterium sp. Leaf180]